ncbi:hypothetical protein PIB30_005555 [Stylosanthes scabra]|uniref:RING-type E3 ubiquitin transferase n=1 Tax=Stylosanthes scabra TaxID=79078 RepID=A0ABU6Q509_9FABA|nr:hypothetical protein [Stylosanthes scabra]
MGMHHRKLFSAQDACTDLCYHDDSPCLSKSDCDECIKKCSSTLNPPPPSSSDALNHSNHIIPTFLIIIVAVVSATLLALFCYAIYVKFYAPRRRTRSRSTLFPLSFPLRLQQSQERNGGEFVEDEGEGGTMVDHPIWYIRTAGLNKRIIETITVLKYKKGEGLVEGTDCSVCLCEFEEDDTLRLLPKCNHAFHLPCIDTWLASHTNCPMCRAPIVTNPRASRLPSMDHPAANVTVTVTPLEEDNSLSEIVVRNGNGSEEQVEVERRNMQPRRSVSLDSSSAAKISAALVAATSVECNGNSKRVAAAKGSTSSSSSSSEPSSMKRSRSFSGKHVLSWYGRNHKKTNPPVRSF